MIKGIPPRKFKPIYGDSFIVPRTNNVYAYMAPSFKRTSDLVVPETDSYFQSKVMYYMLVEFAGREPDNYFRTMEYSIVIPHFVSEKHRLWAQGLMQQEVSHDYIMDRHYSINNDNRWWVYLDRFNYWVQTNTIMTYYRANQQRVFEKQSKEFVQ